MTAGGSEERIPRQFLVSARHWREIVKSLPLRPDVRSLSPGLFSRLIARPLSPLSSSYSSSFPLRNSVHGFIRSTITLGERWLAS